MTRFAGYALAFGTALLAVALVAGLIPVTTSHGGCGTWLAPSGPDDTVWGPACDDAQSSRSLLVLAPALLGVALLAIGGSARLRWRAPNARD